MRHSDIEVRSCCRKQRETHKRDENKRAWGGKTKGQQSASFPSGMKWHSSHRLTFIIFVKMNTHTHAHTKQEQQPHPLSLSHTITNRGTQVHDTLNKSVKCFYSLLVSGVSVTKTKIMNDRTNTVVSVAETKARFSHSRTSIQWWRTLFASPFCVGDLRISVCTVNVFSSTLVEKIKFVQQCMRKFIRATQK